MIGITMNLDFKQQEIRDFTLNLVSAGSHYRVSELAKIYSKDFSIVLLLPDGSIKSMGYAATIDMFTQLQNSGANPLSEIADIKSIDVFEDKAYVILTRNMDFLGAGQAQKIIFHLMLNKTTGGPWEIYREHATFSM